MAASEYTEQDRANEGCCWDYPRDQCPGRRCRCVCHVVKADHQLEAYCLPATTCAMAHPCHRAGCTLRPRPAPRMGTVSECIEVGNVCVSCDELWPCRNARAALAAAGEGE